MGKVTPWAPPSRGQFALFISRAWHVPGMLVHGLHSSLQVSIVLSLQVACISRRICARLMEAMNNTCILLLCLGFYEELVQSHHSGFIHVACRTVAIPFACVSMLLHSN
jgi:hypothetical protein